MLPLVSVTAPTVSLLVPMLKTPPLTVTAPASGRVLVGLFSASVPPVMVVLPVYVLEPESDTVPEPETLNACAPLMADVIFKVLAASATLMFWSAPKTTLLTLMRLAPAPELTVNGPLSVRVLVTPPIVTLLATLKVRLLTMKSAPSVVLKLLAALAAKNTSDEAAG